MMHKYGYSPEPERPLPPPSFAVFFPGAKPEEPAPAVEMMVAAKAPEKVYYYMPWLGGEA